MRALIPADREPIVPFVDRVQELHRDHGVSTVLVVGGVGDYLAVADTVIGMDAYRPQDLGVRARELAGEGAGPAPTWQARLGRLVDTQSLAPTGKGRIRARDGRRVDHGREEIDLVAVEQVRDGAHAATLGHALRVLSHGGPAPIARLLDRLDAILAAEGLDGLSPFPEPHGALVWPRRHEVAAAMNRLRCLRVETGSAEG
jgi:predicted ABC-class ATPase